MRPVFLPLSAALLLLFSGCSSKHYYEPEQAYSAKSATAADGSMIVDLSRDGATLQNGSYIGKKGPGRISLGEGYRFLSESGVYVLAGNDEGVLKIINRKNGKTIRTVKLETPVVSAAIHQGMVAYILNSNTFGLYRISSGEKVIENQSEPAYAIDTRAASPLFIDSLVVMPMLDGKLIVMDSNDPVDAKVIYLSSDQVFNNVIYLSRTGDTLVAATPKRLIAVGEEGQMEYRANISDVAIAGGAIYLFTKEGAIVKLDRRLEVQKKKRFKYAHFAASAVVGKRVYALDQQGSLIVLPTDLSKFKIYDVGEVEHPVFIGGTTLYKDGERIDLSKLDY
jgi:outer membrane protein assembly factor BamB